MHDSFCTATACHQGYFLQLMKHLMMLMLVVGIHIHVLKQTYQADSLGKLKNFKPLCLLHNKHLGAANNFIFFHLCCKKQYQNYNKITVHLEFLEILLTFKLHRKMLNM
jgi:hypothetical protein